MIRGLYIASSGLTMNERMQDVISNNIANATTTGYKSDMGIVRSFPEELLYRMGDLEQPGGLKNPIGSLSYGSLLEEVQPRFIQGALQKSDNPNARAIVDVPNPNQPYQHSYFAVQEQHTNQVMYTRDGDFRAEPGTNYLVTSAGDPVLPIDQATGRPLPNVRIQVQADGSYQYVDLNKNGQPYPGATEGVVDIVDSMKLNKFGDSYFTGGQAVRGTGQIQKGQLEQSNVDLSTQMVSMMNVMRSYEANSKMVQTLNGTLQKAVTIGQLS